jgi:hypothetical protein
MLKLRISLVLMVFFNLSSCITPVAISTEPPKNNSSYYISYLFEHEGCKVYRFYDLGNCVYFTNCTGEIMSFDSPQRTRNIIKN